MERERKAPSRNNTILLASAVVISSRIESLKGMSTWKGMLYSRWRQKLSSSNSNFVSFKKRQDEPMCHQEEMQERKCLRPYEEHR